MTEYLNRKYDLNDDEFIAALDELPIWSAPFGLSLLKAIRLKKGITALDIGFGSGFPVLELAMRLGDSSKVYGIDPFAPGIKRTKAKIKHYGITNVKLIEGVAEAIPLENESIDLIISNNGINNVSDISKTLAECSRIAKKDAQFVLTVNLPDTMLEFYNMYEKVLAENKLDNYIPEIKKHIYKKRKPLPELKNLIENNGFKIRQICEDSFTYDFVDGSAMFRYFFISLAFLESWKNILPHEYQHTIFNQLEKKINQLAEKAGSFTLTIPFVTIDCRRK